MKTTDRRDVPNPTAPQEEVDHEEHPPRLDISARNLAGFAIFVVLAIVALYFLLPQVAGLALTETVRRAAPLAAPVFGRVAAGVQGLEAKARG